MKSAYAFILVLLLAAFSAQAQETIYKQDFNKAGSGLPSGFTSRTNSWAVSQVSPVSNSAGASGASYLRTTASSNSLELNGILVDGFADVAVSWTGYRKTDRGIKTSPIRLFYKINTFTSTGAEQKAAPLNEAVSSSNWELINNGGGIQLPAIGEGAYTIDFKWTVETDPHHNKGAYYAIDDIVITGTRAQPISSLPVELAYFKAQAQGTAARLSWGTAMEQDNEKFVVEHSSNGRSFSKIGEVKGRGTSSTASSYSFTDTKPAPGVNYYRLRQVDFDGTEDFSKVVAVEAAASKAAPLATVYPTVASQEITISLNTVGNASVSVLDINGTSVASFAATAEREVVVPVRELKSGVYFVKVTDGQSQGTQRFIKQ